MATVKIYPQKYCDNFQNTGKILQRSKKNKNIHLQTAKMLIWKFHKIQPKETVIKSLFR